MSQLTPNRRPIGRGAALPGCISHADSAARYEELSRALALQQLMRARCFDEEDRRLVHEHVRAAASRCSADIVDEKSVLLAERKALLSVASAQGMLPSDSPIFHALLEKQLRLQRPK